MIAFTPPGKSALDTTIPAYAEWITDIFDGLKETEPDSYTDCLINSTAQLSQRPSVHHDRTDKRRRSASETLWMGS